jgi:signal transduction histidine kinase
MAPLLRAVLLGAFWLLGVGGLGLALPSHAADPWRIDDLAVLADSSGLERITSVSRPERSGDFTPIADGFSAGYTRAVHWLRFTLHAPPADARGLRETLLEIHPPYVDDLQVYLPPQQAGEAFDVRHGGDLLPQSAKEFAYRAFVYRVAFEDERPRTVYVRLQTSSSSLLVVKAWEPRAFFAKLPGEYAMFGLLLGLLLAGLLANLWQGLWRREAMYRRYIAYLFAVLLNLAGINGLAAEFLLPQAPWWADRWVPVAIILVVLFGVRFYVLALDIANAPPWMRWVYRLQLWLAIACLPTPFLGLYPEAAKILLPSVLPMMLTGAWRSIQLWRQGHGSGIILLFAHLLGLSGNLAAFPPLLGLQSGHFGQIYGFHLRTVGSLLMLQLMLSAHIRAMKTQLAQARLNVEIAKTVAEKDRAEREQQRHFLSMLTHELKTPLSVLQLRLGAANPSARMQAHAERAVDDINAIVERCAMVSRIDEQATPLQRAPCDIARLLDDAIAQHRGAARVRVQRGEGLPNVPVHTDPLLLRTVLANLIDNALKYAPEGSPVHVRLAARSQSGRAGIGIAVENALGKVGLPDPNRIFTKYYRAPGAHQQSGSGLGLYIAQALA